MARRQGTSLQQRRSHRRNLPRRKKPLPLPGTAHEPRRVGRCCRADGMTCECGAPPAHDPNDPARQLPKPQRAENHTLSDKAARCHAASVQGGRYGRPARFSCTHSTAATARHPHSPLSKNKKAVQHRCGTPAGFHSFPFPIRFLFFGSFFSFSERKERTIPPTAAHTPRGGPPDGLRANPSPIRFLFFGSFFSFSERKERTEHPVSFPERKNRKRVFWRNSKRKSGSCGRDLHGFYTGLTAPCAANGIMGGERGRERYAHKMHIFLAQNCVYRAGACVRAVDAI